MGKYIMLGMDVHDATLVIRMELRFAENEAEPGLSPPVEYYFRPCVDPGAEALP